MSSRERIGNFFTVSRRQVGRKSGKKFSGDSWGGSDDQLDKDQRSDPSAIRSRRSALMPSGRQKAASSRICGGVGAGAILL